MRAFAYERPTTLADAVALLAEHGPEARLLAGGTDLIIRLRDGSIRPRVVVDLKRIAELDGAIREGDGRLTIGARTVMTDIAADARIRRDYQALAEAAAVVGSVQIRNRATLAGNICNASPAADTAPALLVYGAVVVAAGPAGTRRIPIDEFFVRSGVTTLARGELVTRDRAAAPDGRRADPSTSGGRDVAATTSPRSPWPARSPPTGSPGWPTAASARGRSSSPTRPACSPIPRRRTSRRCERLEALFVDASPSRDDRCGRAPSTVWRCCASSACGRSATAIERLAEGSGRR